MIQSLRRRHRVMMLSLAFILPSAFVAALVVRQPIPPTPNLPVNSSSLSQEGWQIVFEKNDLWPGLPITTRLYSNHQSDTLFALELQPRENLKTPDILVYWNPTFAFGSYQLPERAQLLGTLAGTEKRRFILPATASVQETSFILYSLAHHKVMAETRLPVVSFLVQRISP